MASPESLMELKADERTFLRCRFRPLSSWLNWYGCINLNWNLWIESSKIADECDRSLLKVHKRSAQMMQWLLSDWLMRFHRVVARIFSNLPGVHWMTQRIVDLGTFYSRKMNFLGQSLRQKHQKTKSSESANGRTHPLATKNVTCIYEK